MALRTELTLRLPNSPGAAADICQKLADLRINVAAMTLQPSGTLHLIVDNHILAAGTLREQRMTVTEQQVIYSVVSHTPGGTAGILRMLARAGANVNYLYGGGGDAQATAALVIGVDDPVRVAAQTGL